MGAKKYRLVADLSSLASLCCVWACLEAACYFKEMTWLYFYVMLQVRQNRENDGQLGGAGA